MQITYVNFKVSSSHILLKRKKRPNLFNYYLANNYSLLIRIFYLTQYNIISTHD